MKDGSESKIFLCHDRDSGTSYQSFASEFVYLMRVDCLYVIKPIVGGFCWRGNRAVGSSINVLTDLILFSYQIAVKYTINFDYNHLINTI